MFIDETWATTTMARRHGRARRGQRLVAAVPHGHWKTTTFLAALCPAHHRLLIPHGLLALVGNPNLPDGLRLVTASRGPPQPLAT